MPNRATIGVNNAEADRMHSETEHQGRALSAPRMPSGTCGSWHHLSRRVVNWAAKCSREALSARGPAECYNVELCVSDTSPFESSFALINADPYATCTQDKTPLTSAQCSAHRPTRYAISVSLLNGRQGNNKTYDWYRGIVSH
ncbi:unnamed protein product [Lampetra fluviatilis]